jgi:hypothetical protein
VGVLCVLFCGEAGRPSPFFLCVEAGRPSPFVFLLGFWFLLTYKVLVCVCCLVFGFGFLF